MATDWNTLEKFIFKLTTDSWRRFEFLMEMMDGIKSGNSGHKA